MHRLAEANHGTFEKDMKLPWEEIEELTKYLEQEGLSEISIETKDGKISVKKDSQGEVKSTVLPSLLSETKTGTLTEKQDSLKSKLYQVTAPMVGTFYAAPTPGAEPFVKVGSRVNPGDILYVIEATKILNELPAEVGGVITEITVKDNQTVEYGRV